MNKLLTLPLLIASTAHGAERIGVGFLEVSSPQNPSEVLLHSSSQINKKSTIDFEYETSPGKIKCCQRISGLHFNRIETDDKVSADGEQANIYTYKANLNNLPKVGISAMIGTAIINSDSTSGSNQDVITARKGNEEFTIERCYGIEGINLYRKKNGETLEHLYLYLNIDIESTCQ